MPPNPVRRLNYAVGDLVFAKVIGYPPWPARIVAEPPPGYTVGPGKYPVFFFGTYESAVVAVQYLWPYLETRHLLGILRRRRRRQRKQDTTYFNKALDEIENNPNLGVVVVDDDNSEYIIDGQEVMDNSEEQYNTEDETEDEEEEDMTEEEFYETNDEEVEEMTEEDSDETDDDIDDEDMIGSDNDGYYTVATAKDKLTENKEIK
ncbi:hepatoma-derived growth factor-related protein 3-like [Oppia nitens]|uniref:hepatoma-derived growth factor-related protein 3-like n=1 Tax=Oppia nitens TaxID=1686743 RepID=UPI0023DC9320|nr:hepatoma-derived growth factor-related protein 3-like [Oppia nitens]